MDWYNHISLNFTIFRNSCYSWREKIPSKSYLGEEKMPNTMCRKCGIELWNSYNYCSQHMPEFLDRFYKQQKINDYMKYTKIIPGLISIPH